MQVIASKGVETNAIKFTVYSSAINGPQTKTIPIWENVIFKIACVCYFEVWFGIHGWIIGQRVHNY